MKKGFTLIELLVVIAIIGILSSIVVASVNSARAKGFDASIKANLTNLRSQASIYYDNNGQSYGSSASDCAASGTIFSDPNVASQISAVSNSAPQAPSCANTDQTWAVSVELNQGGSWCIDSNGMASSTTISTSTALCL